MQRHWFCVKISVNCETLNWTYSSTIRATGLHCGQAQRSCGPPCSGPTVSICLLVHFHVWHGRVQRGELSCLVAKSTCDTAFPPHSEMPTPLARQSGIGQLLSSPSITLSASGRSGLPIKWLWFPYKQGQRDWNQRVRESHSISLDQRSKGGEEKLRAVARRER